MQDKTHQQEIHNFLQNQHIYIHKHPRFNIGGYFAETILKFGGTVENNFSESTTIVITRSDVEQKIQERCKMMKIPILNTSWIIQCNISRQKVNFDSYFYNKEKQEKIGLINQIKIQIKQQVETSHKEIINKIQIFIDYCHHEYMEAISHFIKIKNSINSQLKYQIIIEIQKADLIVTENIHSLSDYKIYALLKGISITSLCQIFQNSFNKTKYKCLNYQIVKSKIFLNRKFNIFHLNNKEQIIWRQIITILGGQINKKGELITLFKLSDEEKWITLNKIRGNIRKKCNISFPKVEET